LIHPNAALWSKRISSRFSPRPFLLSLTLAGTTVATTVVAKPVQAQAPTPERLAQAATLISESLTLAERESGVTNSRTRLNVVRGAASLLPQLAPTVRQPLTSRWLRLALSSGVPREVRLAAMSDFFDEASRRDVNYARPILGSLPDPAARAGGLLQLSERVESINWTTANQFAEFAHRSARQERDIRNRARALTFVAHRLSVLNPETRYAAVVEASSNVKLMQPSRDRDYLLAEVVGAASRFDLGLARRVSADISDADLKNLAEARIGLAEASQTTITVSTSDRIAALAKAAARYDVRAIPILIQLPPQSDVLQALSNALPAIYPTAQPAIEVNLLERMWDYSNRAEASVYKDQLQSRLARLMVLHDVWRGRSWGKQLAWRGGRIQVGAFLKDVLQSRRSRLNAEPLQDLAQRNISRAIVQARTFAPAPRSEALLLLAGQILG
jgi:hypothetical protein